MTINDELKTYEKKNYLSVKVFDIMYLPSFKFTAFFICLCVLK